MNYDHKKCVSCVHLGEESRSPSFNTAKKTAALQAVYRSVIGPLLQPPAVPPDDFPSKVRENSAFAAFINFLLTEAGARICEFMTFIYIWLIPCKS